MDVEIKVEPLKSKLRGQFRLETGDEMPRLRGEVEWLFSGPKEVIDSAAEALGGICQPLAEGLLSVDFGNRLGIFDVPWLGRLEVYTKKWGSRDYDEMLRELTEVAAGLPYAVAGGGLRFERGVVHHKRVLYHLFTYLRYIILGDAPQEEKLVPALRVILREPHRRFERVRRDVPLERVRRADPGIFAGIAAGRCHYQQVSEDVGERVRLAKYLRGYLPVTVSEGQVDVSLDAPENRFVKALLNEISHVIAEVRTLTRRSQRRGVDWWRLLRECDDMEKALRPILADALWSEVGKMVQVPASSTVLQRRHGYREVYQCFARMRLGSRVPLDEEVLRRLMEAKDVALLYELWCYFEVIKGLKGLIGEPKWAGEVEAKPFAISAPRGLQVEWADGTRLIYNRTFSQTSGEWKAYSLRPRPDIALFVPRGVNKGLHIFDAKFKLKRYERAAESDGALEDEDPDIALTEGLPEFGGLVTSGDIYTMHMYRDSILDARSAWALYPGDSFRFYGKSVLGEATSAAALPTVVKGVGAIPMQPRSKHGQLRKVLVRLLGVDEC